MLDCPALSIDAVVPPVDAVRRHSQENSLGRDLYARKDTKT